MILSLIIDLKTTSYWHHVHLLTSDPRTWCQYDIDLISTQQTSHLCWAGMSKRSRTFLYHPSPRPLTKMAESGWSWDCHVCHIECWLTPFDKRVKPTLMVLYVSYCWLLSSCTWWLWLRISIVYTWSSIFQEVTSTRTGLGTRVCSPTFLLA